MGKERFNETFISPGDEETILMKGQRASENRE